MHLSVLIRQTGGNTTCYSIRFREKLLNYNCSAAKNKTACTSQWHDYRYNEFLNSEYSDCCMAVSNVRMYLLTFLSKILRNAVRSQTVTLGF